MENPGLEDRVSAMVTLKIPSGGEYLQECDKVNRDFITWIKNRDSNYEATPDITIYGISSPELLVSTTYQVMRTLREDPPTYVKAVYDPPNVTDASD